MKLATLKVINTPFHIRNEIELPPLRRGQVLVKLAYRGVFHSQIMDRCESRSDPDRDIPVFANLYLEGKLLLYKLITHRYCLVDINQALDDLEQNRVVRPLIEMNSIPGAVI
jgi:Zn-dependent alcohol dehydrogenase